MLTVLTVKLLIMWQVLIILLKILITLIVFTIFYTRDVFSIKSKCVLITLFHNMKSPLNIVDNICHTNIKFDRETWLCFLFTTTFHNLQDDDANAKCYIFLLGISCFCYLFSILPLNTVVIPKQCGIEIEVHKTSYASKQIEFYKLIQILYNVVLANKLNSKN